MAKILIVENDLYSLELLANTLREAGHQVELAFDGMDALSQLSAGDPPDVLVCGIIIPKMNGLTLIKQARQLHPHLTIIATAPDNTTSHLHPADLNVISETAKKNGANATFSRPLNTPVLLSKIEEICII